MNFFAARMLRTVCALGLLALAVDNAQAVVITDFGVDVATKRYAIDASRSSLTFNPGAVVFGNPAAEAEIYQLSGFFDVTFEHYWWDYQVEGSASQDVQTYSSDWIRLAKPDVMANGTALPANFAFPAYFIGMIGSNEFAGDNLVCTMPLGPNASCSGSSNGPFPSLAGHLSANAISFDGSQPYPEGSLFSGYTYHIEASVVPLPAAFWLFASGLGVVLLRGKWR
ncbi:hypothetical protein [Methylomonas koyamae]|uniref:hypothetical protein n=1 Tax=Methylomonas koyamae TaxID=702114 RepID=UPI002873622C|nr:hypothetical protein [Methylomonas koyamae]WNB74885.1 hypothetical protein RI210_16580 [Methylomonas koyamae]